MSFELLFENCIDDDGDGITIHDVDNDLQIRIFDTEIATMVFEPTEDNFKIIDQMGDALKNWVKEQREK